jgi:peptide/nickel transport system substrate-binding protein
VPRLAETEGSAREWAHLKRLLLSCLVAFCSACRPSSPEASATIAVRADVTGFFPNPPAKDESFTNRVNAEIFEGLTRLDPDGRIAPALAERWETPDERTYVFHLRPGLQFSDGSPLTSADVVASLRTNIERDWPTAGYLRNIGSIEADGPLRVIVRTRVPYPLLLYKLPWGYVLPSGVLGLRPVPLVGAGPYRLVTWEKDRSFTLERNDLFRGPRPAIGRVRFEIVPDGGDRVARLVSGRVDVVDEVPLEDVDALRFEKEIRVFAAPSLRVLFLTLRVTEPPFSDPRVREAVDLALDRDELVERAYDGKTVTASQLVPPSIVGFNPALGIRMADRARSRALLAQAGFPKGFDVRLDGTHNRYVNDLRILREVARQLALVGIRVTVNALEKTEFFELIDAGASSFHLVGWACGSGEAAEAIEALVATRGPGLGSANSSGYSDSVLDGLLARSNEALRPRVRVEALQAALARVAEQRPVLPLLLQAEAIAVSRRIDWVPGRDMRIRIEDMRLAQ